MPLTIPFTHTFCPSHLVQVTWRHAAPVVCSTIDLFCLFTVRYCWDRCSNTHYVLYLLYCAMAQMHPGTLMHFIKLQRLSHQHYLLHYYYHCNSCYYCCYYYCFCLCLCLFAFHVIPWSIEEKNLAWESRTVVHLGWPDVELHSSTHFTKRCIPLPAKQN